MRSQNRKVKFAEFKLAPIGSCIGKISCLGMLGLGIVLVCPTCGNAASALTSAELESGSLTSSVSIAFAPASGSTSLSPTTASGASGLISVLANVDVTNSGGYSVYLGSNSTNLVGKNDPTNVIPGVSGEVSFASLQDNTWGYYAGEGTSVPEAATYKAISQGQGDIILVNNNSRVKNESKTFILSFAAKIDNNTPADIYENQVTLSVVSNPYQLTLIDIDNMQDMTTAICENTPSLQTKQLKDIRDGKYYWVTKLADNKCWMTQNLDLDIKTSSGALNTSNTTPPVGVWPDVALSDYDVVPSTTVYATSTTAASRTIDPSVGGTYSFSLGDVVIKNPNIASSCGVARNSATNCTAQFVSIVGKISSANPNFYEQGTTISGNEYDAHYTLGNLYQWNVATAGASGSVTSEESVTTSICPKGWRLPTASYIGSSDFSKLVGALGGTSTIDNVTKPPFYGVRGGDVVPYNTQLYELAGDVGTYWSSTAFEEDGIVNGMYLYFSSNFGVLSSSHYKESLGRSIRCVAR